MKDVVRSTIDGKEYLFYQLTPKKAFKVLSWVTRKLGKPLGGIFASFGSVDFSKDVSNLKLDSAKLADALAGLFEGLAEEDENIAKIEVLLSSVEFSGSSLNFDHPNFQGDTKHLLKVIWKALEVNFSDFLGGSFAIAEKLKTAISSMRAKLV